MINGIFPVRRVTTTVRNSTTRYAFSFLIEISYEASIAFTIKSQLNEKPYSDKGTESNIIKLRHYLNNCQSVKF